MTMSRSTRANSTWLRVLPVLASLVLSATAADAPPAKNTESHAGWIPLFDGKSTSGWASRGDSKWAVQDGELRTQAGSPGGFLATTREFADFQLHAEFWIDDKANSGVFLRCPAAGDITSLSAYEVNIFDPHPKWPTGSISEVAKTSTPQKTIGRWNSVDITANDDHLVVVLNGACVVDARDARHTRGAVALQHLKGEGEVRFRNIKIKPLESKPK
jgi:hypothetical protein